MDKKRQASLILLFGAILIIVAAVLHSALHGAAFVVLLSIGILSSIAGAIDLFSAFYVRKKTDQPDTEEEVLPEYRKKPAILSVSERNFYAALKHMLDARYFDIFPQSALISVIDKLTHTNWRNELFRIADFCIVDATTTQPLLLIELNDASHNRAERKLRDQKVQKICERAGLTLLTFTLAEAADIKYVQQTLKAHLR